MPGSKRLRIISAHLSAAPANSSAATDLAAKTGDTVCVTGAAGYVGGWLVRLLLQRGYSVRACVRDTADLRKVGFLTAMPQHGTTLSLHAADMTLAGAYDQVFAGCTTVFHAAEVFMSFGSGRNKAQAKAKLHDTGTEKLSTVIHTAAVSACNNIVESILKSGTVRRLVYTSSVAAVMGANTDTYNADPCISELREPDGMPPSSYNATKRVTEKFFDYAAAASGGKWSVVVCNPSDIIGPIQSHHQARETWQGKLAAVVQGLPARSEAGRPWFLVDVRDVAKAQILLAEAGAVHSGERFLCTSGDVLPPEHIRERIQLIRPDWDVSVGDSMGSDLRLGDATRIQSLWLRVYLRNNKLRDAVGFSFRSFDDTIGATLDALVDIGQVRPRPGLNGNSAFTKANKE